MPLPFLGPSNVLYIPRVCWYFGCSMFSVLCCRCSMLLLCAKWNIFSLLIHALSTSMRSSHVLVLLILALCFSCRFCWEIFIWKTLSRFRAQFRIRHRCWHRCCHRLPLTIRKMERDRQILFSLCVCFISLLPLRLCALSSVCYGKARTSQNVRSHVFFLYYSCVSSLIFSVCFFFSFASLEFITHLHIYVCFYRFLSTFYKNISLDESKL